MLSEKLYAKFVQKKNTPLQSKQDSAYRITKKEFDFVQISWDRRIYYRFCVQGCNTVHMQNAFFCEAGTAEIVSVLSRLN